MKLSLSVRVAEKFSNKRETNISLPNLATIAKKAGYEALCMRASMVGVHSTQRDILNAKQIADENNLSISMITGDFAIPENGSEGPECLSHITPHLELAEHLGCDLLRVCLKNQNDIPFAQRAADEAKERNIRLAHQSHTQSLFETVAGSLDTLKKINRPNFGLIYEPANLALCDQSYGADTLQAFAPYIFNVYLQNHVPDPNGDLPMITWTKGVVPSTLRPLDESGGINFQTVFDGLKSISYTGYVTLHHAFGDNMPPQEAANRSADFLKSFLI